MIRTTITNVEHRVTYDAAEVLPINLYIGKPNAESMFSTTPMVWWLKIEQAEQLAAALLDAAREARGDVPTDGDSAECRNCGKLIDPESGFYADSDGMVCESCCDSPANHCNAG